MHPLDSAKSSQLTDFQKIEPKLLRYAVYEGLIHMQSPSHPNLVYKEFDRFQVNLSNEKEVGVCLDH